MNLLTNYGVCTYENLFHTCLSCCSLNGSEEYRHWSLQSATQHLNKQCHCTIGFIHNVVLRIESNSYLCEKEVQTMES